MFKMERLVVSEQRLYCPGRWKGHWGLVLVAPLWLLRLRESSVVLQIFFGWSCHSLGSWSKLARLSASKFKVSLKAAETKCVFGSGVSGSLIDGHLKGKGNVPKPTYCAVGQLCGWQISTPYVIQTFHLLLLMALRTNSILSDCTSRTSTTMRIKCCLRRRNSWSSTSDERELLLSSSESTLSLRSAIWWTHQTSTLPKWLPDESDCDWKTSHPNKLDKFVR